VLRSSDRRVSQKPRFVPRSIACPGHFSLTILNDEQCPRPRPARMDVYRGRLGPVSPNHPEDLLGPFSGALASDLTQLLPNLVQRAMFA
jgi:hypothetical protein